MKELALFQGYVAIFVNSNSMVLLHLLWNIMLFSTMISPCISSEHSPYFTGCISLDAYLTGWFHLLWPRCFSYFHWPFHRFIRQSFPPHTLFVFSPIVFSCQTLSNISCTISHADHLVCILFHFPCRPLSLYSIPFWICCRPRVSSSHPKYM